MIEYFKTCNPSHRDRAIALFNQLPCRPSIGESNDGDRMMFCWDSDNHHFEIEFGASGPFEAFYRDRKTENNWLIEFMDTIPVEVIETIKKINNV